MIDVGLKTEGRIAVKEFGVDEAGKPTLKVGDTVEVFLERIENALGEAVISRDKARREEAWTRLEGGVRQERAGHGRHRRPREGRLHRRPRRGFGLPAWLTGGHPAGARRRPADGPRTAVRDPQDGPPARQHRGLPSRHPGRGASRAAHRTGQPAARRRGARRRGQEHHRLRRVRGPGRHRRPAARHGHELEARLPPEPGPGGRRHGQGPDHQDQSGDPAHQPGHEAAAVRPMGRRRGRNIRSAPSSPAGSPTSPTTAPSWSWRRASRAWSTSRR